MDASGIPVFCSFNEIVPIKKAVPNPNNPNRHPPEQIRLLAKIIKAQGWRSPIIMSRRSGFIVKGHGRLMAAEVLDVDEVPVDWQEYATEAEEWADLQADNQIAELAEWDSEAAVAKMLEFEDEIDLELFGIPEGDLKDLLKEAEEPPDDPGAQIDRAEELKHEWKTEYGQVWEIPSKSSPERCHRVMCGDSTSEEDMLKLMGGAMADMIFTDPPYGVSYADKNAFLNAVSPANRIQKGIIHDHETVSDMAVLWGAAFSKLYSISKPGCVYYITGPQGGELMMMMMRSISNARWILKHMLIWVKNNHVLGRSDYNYKHEPILYGWKDGGHKFYGGASETSVWEIDKPHKSGLHPTTKPTELVERAIGNSSRPGDLVVDSFLGSGTTVIAAERAGRVCYGMEIDPEYCAVILQRCLDMGLEPKKVS